MKNNPRLVPSFKTVALAIWCAVSTALAQPYLVTDLGTLGGNSSGAQSINDSGTVVGYAYGVSGNCLKLVDARLKSLA